MPLRSGGFNDFGGCTKCLDELSPENTSSKDPAAVEDDM
jgi:hypothetical protein